MTNFEKIKNMTMEEMATTINNGISSDPCDYCTYDETFCNCDPCVGKDDFDVIVEWLGSEVEE